MRAVCAHVCVYDVCARCECVHECASVCVCERACVHVHTRNRPSASGRPGKGGRGRVYEVTVSVAMSMGCSIVSMVVSGPSTSVVMVMMGTVPSSVTSSTTVISSTV